MSEKSTESSSSAKPSGSSIPKPSGLKPPTASSSQTKISRICAHHDKKPDLPDAATPKKGE